MVLQESEYFQYHSNKLHCENCSINHIADNVGTPFYIYSRNFMEDKYKEYQEAFNLVRHRIFYASKANYNINIIKLMNDLGAGIDVNSAGEFLRARKAGVSPADMILSGVGKTEEEIKLVLENEILLIKSESFDEIGLIDRVASEHGKIAPIAIRVNPNVDPSTHPYISTGLAENKFGVDETSAIEIFKYAHSLKNIKLCGIDMHIGSQITKIEPYAQAIKKLVDIVEQLKSFGILLKHIDIGGGMGIDYYNNDNPFSPSDLANEIIPIFSETDCEIFIEPGRSLTANGGALITKVLYVKKNLDKNFIIVDGAMNDLLRPSIYKAYHHIQPVNKTNSQEIVADIVGPICESGDFFGKSRNISLCRPEDLLAVQSAGAYGMVMSSNYNARRRPAEVLVDDNKYYTIRKRETYEQLMQNEEIISF